MAAGAGVAVAAAAAALVAAVGGAAPGTLAQSDSPSWRVRDIGAPRGARDPLPLDVNDRGTILVEDLARGRGSVWQRGRWVDLGSLGGGKTDARALNERGDVVGQSARRNGQRHAFRWRAGQMVDLTPRNKSSTAVAVNIRGDVVGSIILGKERGTRAFLWRKGKVVALDVPGGAYTTAAAVNGAGAVVGTYVKDGQERGVIWRNGQAVDLGTLPAAQWRHESPQHVVPTAINDRGEVVGIVHGDYAGSEWFIWRKGVMATFATSPNSAEESAVAINRNGQVLVQVSGRRGTSRAWLYDDDKLIPLPTLGGPSTGGAGLNNKGWIAGMSQPMPNRYRPFVWRSGRMIALDTPARRYAPPWPSVSAINNRGQIVGYDYTERGQHILVWNR